MIRFHFILVLLFGLFSARGQVITTASVFAHNDYDQPVAFFVAYASQVGYIEADVFLEGNELMVAHHHHEIKKGRTLDELYLKPLAKKLELNSGHAYTQTDAMLTLMIDLKTDGVATLNTLVKKLKQYPKLISCPSLQITVSGNVPDVSLWKNFPAFIHFDGRPGVNYSKEQLDRISLISTSFGDYSQWNGKGVLTKGDREKIETQISNVHKLGKKFRFWGAPDFTNGWLTLIKLKVDIVGSDHITGLVKFINDYQKNTFQNNATHTVYQPQYNFKVGVIPKNIILMIGDGMGLTQLYSGFTANQGSLNIFNIKQIGFSITTASDSYITDSAAGATAMSTGSKTNNRFIGVDDQENKLLLITEALKQKKIQDSHYFFGRYYRCNACCILCTSAREKHARRDCK